jgi:hypothetical protein
MIATFLNEYKIVSMPEPVLKGRVALVTGVSRRKGIGFAIARKLAAMGANVFIHSFSPYDADLHWGADPDGISAVNYTNSFALLILKDDGENRKMPPD